MVNILVVSHGDLSIGLLDSLSLLIGSEKNICALSLKEGMNPELFKQKVQDTISSLDDGSGVLVLLDLFGGTPSNVCMQLLGSNHIECVTGVNLPMLIECVSQSSDCTLDELVHVAIKTAKNSNVSLRNVLEQQSISEISDDEF